MQIRCELCYGIPSFANYDGALLSRFSTATHCACPLQTRLSRGTRCLPSAQTRTARVIRLLDSSQGGLTAKWRAYLFGLSRFAPALFIHSSQELAAAGAALTPKLPQLSANATYTRFPSSLRLRAAFRSHNSSSGTWGCLRGAAWTAPPRTSRTSPSRRASSRPYPMSRVGICWKRNAG